MHPLRAFRQSLAVLVLSATFLATAGEAAPLPSDFTADSTIVAGTSNSVLGIDSDTHLAMVLLPLLPHYLLNQNFRIAADGYAHAVTSRLTVTAPCR